MSRKRGSDGRFIKDDDVVDDALSAYELRAIRKKERAKRLVQ